MKLIVLKSYVDDLETQKIVTEKSKVFQKIFERLKRT